jgi:uncharacterized protein (UPF0333 family)
MKNTIIVIIVIAVLIGGYYWYKSDKQEASPTQANSKINVEEVCRGALAYMSFPDGASAEAFVQECKEGKHPEVIEKYKADLNLNAGVEI